MLRKNEKEANIIVAKVMRITFIIFTLVYFLNIIGVFVIDKTIMAILFFFELPFSLTGTPLE